MKKIILATVIIVTIPFSSLANNEYPTRLPFLVDSDLTEAWTVQFNRKKIQQHAIQHSFNMLDDQQQALLNSSADSNPSQKSISLQVDTKFQPQTVLYKSSEEAGTIIIDTRHRFLYLILENNRAQRYGIGVGKTGFEWTGTEKITRKAKWPSWRPPKQMIEREKKKGRILPTYMAGGLDNPLGARALYLGSTLYRIHGTNQPWTIGYAVSSGCIRMRNQDILDLYGRVKIGTKVLVL